jgi:hypothetical protein
VASDFVTIELRPAHFGDSETVLAASDGLTASTCRYASGVAGLRLRNEAGHITLLPFQGQQIWNAQFLGRRLTMQSMFAEPYPTLDYLRTYGGFLIHCGATAMGVPGHGDTHPLHGELPNARYQRAQLIVGRDEHAPYMALTGTYRHTVAFSHNYEAQPTITLASSSSRIRASLNIRNLRNVPMELMYLAHINFRPVDHATLIDTVLPGPPHVRVRTSLPPQLTPSEAYLRLVKSVRANPDIHRHIEPERMIDPELVLILKCFADEAGWAHSMQLHPDGSADFVSHRPDQLAHALRWMSRNIDQDALGLLLPATAEADGYTAEKAKGNLVPVAPHGGFACSFEFGALERNDAARLQRKIDKLVRDRTTA